jgi:hypothetical protein
MGSLMAYIANNPDYTGLFRDKRPEKRGLQFLAY